MKDLLLRVLAVEDEAGLCHILSSCLHVWAGGGGGGGEGEHGTGYTSLISSQSSSMDGKLGKYEYNTHIYHILSSHTLHTKMLIILDHKKHHICGFVCIDIFPYSV